MKNMKSTAVLVAGFAVAFTLAGCDGCKKRNDQTVPPTQTSVANEPPVAPKPTRILTKLPDYFKAWNGEKNEDALLMKYSHAYAVTSQSITEKTSGIADPQLRATALSDAWSRIDEKTRDTWQVEAQRNFKQHQSEFLSNNADKVFELGRVGYVLEHVESVGSTDEGDNTCDAESRNGFAWINSSAGDRLLELCRGDAHFLQGPVAIKLSIASLDDILRRFDSLHVADVQACVDALYAQNRDVIEKEIADSGMPRNEAMAEATKEGRNLCIPQVRENLRVFAQGDLLHQKLTKLLIMDYLTENVLEELPATEIVSLVRALDWTKPNETGICYSRCNER